MISSEAPETNITLTTQNLITPDPLLFHTNTVSNTTTDVLNKLLNDNYETESMLSANNSNGDHLLGMAHTVWPSFQRTTISIKLFERRIYDVGRYHFAIETSQPVAIKHEHF